MAEEDDFSYDEVKFDDLQLEDDEEETFEDMLRTVEGDRLLQDQKVEDVELDTKPEVIEDFVRNFLSKMGLAKSMETFESEWYQLKQLGKLKDPQSVGFGGAVPDVYNQNQILEQQLQQSREEITKMRDVTNNARGTYDKLRKQRDFHKMHHKRVVQEKEKLVVDLKRLKKHCEGYEPILEGLKKKYDAAMKQLALIRIERDKVRAEAETLRAAEAAQRGPGDKSDSKNRSGSQRSRTTAQATVESELPADHRVNPFSSLSLNRVAAENFMQIKSFKGATQAISALAYHPKKDILATASDDFTWHMYSLPECELIRSGEGHLDWIGDLAFHPGGTLLATGSADQTVKLWDLVNLTCHATLSGHTGCVWSVAFHDTGDFLCSASLDHTVKLWDIHAESCKQTLRGHVDSVNAVCFQPFSNQVCTASADKTVSMWDLRSGLCIETFYGHTNAVNDVSFSIQGDTIASVDADGCCKIWDIRSVAIRSSVQESEQDHSLNKCTFDKSGRTLAVASDDCSIKIINVDTGTVAGLLNGHTDRVQAVLFDPESQSLMSGGGGSDCTVRVWK